MNENNIEEMTNEKVNESFEESVKVDFVPEESQPQPNVSSGIAIASWLSLVLALILPIFGLGLGIFSYLYCADAKETKVVGGTAVAVSSFLLIANVLFVYFI